MGDLRALSSPASSSSSSAHPYPPASLRGEHRTFLSKCPQFGASQSNVELYRNARVTYHAQKAFQWRALLDDQRLPFGIHMQKLESAARGEEDLNLFDRLALAWKILFPTRKKTTSPAEIAKQRLKMILISDRCSVNDKAKRKIVNNIVGALADFVEIESQDRVKLNVSADPDLGTVYSVSVPVRRVRPEFQGNDNDGVDDKLREEGTLELKEICGSAEALDVKEVLPPMSENSGKDTSSESQNVEAQ